MARWLKVIDDVLKVKVHHLQTGRIKNSEFIDWVDKQPTIEAEPVIRCRDCDVPHNKWTGCPKLNGLVPPNDFYCAFGVRRDSDGETD